MTQQQRDIKRKLAVLEYARGSGNVAKTCRRFGISRQCYYNWLRAFERRGEAVSSTAGPVPRTTPCGPRRPSRRRSSTCGSPTTSARRASPGTSAATTASASLPTASTTCSVRNGINRLPVELPQALDAEHALPEADPRPSRPSRREVPALGRFRRPQGEALPVHGDRRCHPDQGTAVYEKHTQADAIDFIDHVIERFPFRIHTVRTDNGHEFQTKFHWHVEDRGIRHVYIKPASPNLNGKVERSHLTDKLEFYQLLDYTDDVDLARETRRLGGVLQRASPPRRPCRTHALRDLKEKMAS